MTVHCAVQKVSTSTKQPIKDASHLKHTYPDRFEGIGDCKALTDTEQRYANIERELLAVVFGCERFHTYVYGKPFVVESDHKPLEMIQKKKPCKYSPTSAAHDASLSTI